MDRLTLITGIGCVVVVGVIGLIQRFLINRDAKLPGAMSEQWIRERYYTSGKE